MEPKVEVKTGVKDTAETMKGKQVIDDLEFIQGLINLASLSRI